MENHSHERERERCHLAFILTEAGAQLRAAMGERKNRQSGLAESAMDMWDNAAQGINGMDTMDRFHELVGLSQFVATHSVLRSMRQMSEQRENALRRMLDTPYFARIDVRFDEEEEAEAIYIGRATLKDEKTNAMYIHDWRTPIASVFYRFGAGPAHYDAPMGRIDCALLLKRQYEIRKGELIYFFDADVEVSDEFLRKLLAQNTSSMMKAIVETIQKEQDVAIRDAQHDLLMIDGAAGSGKTSVALHRVAYLMYQKLTAPLSSSNIVILSPNTLFERYVSAVLPELGEDSVRTMTCEQLFAQATGRWPILHNGDRLERIYTAKAKDQALYRACARFKASDAFVMILNRFLAKLPNALPYEDIIYGGETITTRQQLKARVLSADAHMPLCTILHRLERSIWDGVHDRRAARMDILRERVRNHPGLGLDVEALARAYSMYECAALKRRLHTFTRLDIRALYAELFSDEGRFFRLAAGIVLPDDIHAILRYTHERMKDPVLDYEDAAAIAYLNACVAEKVGDANIRQLVVDEVQDYGPIHFELLKRMFPNARFTLLGDMQQVLNGPVRPSLYDDAARILAKKSHMLMRLNKSFRCTKQILEFSRQFLDENVQIEAFNREGEKPVLHVAANDADCAANVIGEIARCAEKGYQSIALIAKSARDAGKWRDRLGENADLALVDEAGIDMPRGAFLLPLALCKGLEFDAVLILDCDEERYSLREDRSLLYVACTRALHRLALFCAERPSALIRMDERKSS